MGSPHPSFFSPSLGLLILNTNPILRSGFILKCRSLLVSFSWLWLSPSFLPTAQTVEAANSGVFSVFLVKVYVLTCDLVGAVKTAVFPPGVQRTLPSHLPVKTAPTTGRGMMDWTVVLLTSRPIPPLPLSAITVGTGPTTLSVATLPRPLPIRPTHPTHLANLEGILMIQGTNVLPPRSASSVLVFLPLVPKVSLLALFPA